ncbi:MAG: hypothetical protein QOD29_4834, partial [Alphaproteobacteria bacterium]|nr:hypothetical protein [Alphaproteobacteria bacterium]
MRTVIFPTRLALLIGILVAAAATPPYVLRGEDGAIAPLDEAQLAGRDAATFPQAKEDYFHDMDNGVP